MPLKSHHPGGGWQPAIHPLPPLLLPPPRERPRHAPLRRRTGCGSSKAEGSRSGSSRDDCGGGHGQPAGGSSREPPPMSPARAAVANACRRQARPAHRSQGAGLTSAAGHVGIERREDAGRVVLVRPDVKAVVGDPLLHQRRHTAYIQRIAPEVRMSDAVIIPHVA